MTYPDNTTKTCNKCSVVKPLEGFSPHKDFPDGLHTTCKECLNAKARQRWADLPPEEKQKRNAQIQAQQTPEQRRAISKRYSRRHPDAVLKHKRKARLKFLAQRRQVIAHYSDGTNQCACCGESQFEFLVIDHIDGGGGQHRKEQNLTGSNRLATWLIKNNYPEGFRILCHNCNMCRGAYGYCPHESPELTPEIARVERMCSTSVNYRFRDTTPSLQNELFKE